ncbi:RDD family protein [Rhodococcus sp. T2V]|uniref:RDD family protein n=1 Tax=Rhodococcus sp. T2V TaxID=3034164 RepID=UPI0023E25F24|nr:RDD family protein [Rhodococcus sp. T2V]MDF3311771.1 RDD family protein [Rhodococcus sp. T2V]
MDVLPAEAYTSWLRRVGAFVIDQLLYMILAVGLGVGGGVIIGMADGTSCSTGESNDATSCSSAVFEGIVSSIVTLVVLAYWFWNWGYRQGRTGSSIGKSVLKFKVVSERTGRPIGFRMSLVRQVAHILDAIFYIGYLLPLFTAKRQTIADTLVKTVCLPIEPLRASTPQPPPAYGTQQPPRYGTSVYGTSTAHWSPRRQPYGTPANVTPSYNARGSAYGTAPSAGYGIAQRPGTVTAAAVLALVMAALTTIASLVSLYTSSHYHPRTGAVTAALYLSLVGLVFAGLLVWGGVAVSRGRANKALLWTSSVAVVLYLVDVGVSTSDYGRVLGVVCSGLAVVVVTLILQTSSKDFFRTRGATTT